MEKPQAARWIATATIIAITTWRCSAEEMELPKGFRQVPASMVENGRLVCREANCSFGLPSPSWMWLQTPASTKVQRYYCWDPTTGDMVGLTLSRTAAPRLTAATADEIMAGARKAVVGAGGNMAETACVSSDAELPGSFRCPVEITTTARTIKASWYVWQPGWLVLIQPMPTEPDGDTFISGFVASAASIRTKVDDFGIGASGPSVFYIFGWIVIIAACHGMGRLCNWWFDRPILDGALIGLGLFAAMDLIGIVGSAMLGDAEGVGGWLGAALFPAIVGVALSRRNRRRKREWVAEWGPGRMASAD
ncbi:MAG: hypothetical protein U0166_03420 [Acidobacteriota bacterium]